MFASLKCSLHCVGGCIIHFITCVGVVAYNASRLSRDYLKMIKYEQGCLTGYSPLRTFSYYMLPASVFFVSFSLDNETTADALSLFVSWN